MVFKHTPFFINICMLINKFKIIVIMKCIVIFMFYVTIKVSCSELILLSKEQGNDYHYRCIPLDKSKNEIITWFGADNLPLEDYHEIDDLNSSEGNNLSIHFNYTYIVIAIEWDLIVNIFFMAVGIV